MTTALRKRTVEEGRPEDDHSEFLASISVAWATIRGEPYIKERNEPNGTLLFMHWEQPGHWTLEVRSDRPVSSKNVWISIDCPNSDASCSWSEAFPYSSLVPGRVHFDVLTLLNYRGIDMDMTVSVYMNESRS